MPTRRTFLRNTAAGLLGGPLLAAEPVGGRDPKLAGEVGVTTGSFVKHLSPTPKPGKLCLLDLPKIMRDELGMKVIDLMTATLASFEPEYLDKLRNEAEKAGCVLTNLKMNLTGVDLDSDDADTRAKAVAAFKAKIDAAARLGVRWVRPSAGAKKPDMKRHAAGLKELIAYAVPHKIQVLIENNRWMSGDPDAIPAVVKAVGPELGVSPDTGNWKEAVRYDGLAKAFPFAVTCDFKALELGPDGAHAAYDLKKCFRIGWDAGFRGPWCLEHTHAELSGLYKEFVWLRDQLKGWMKEAK